MANNIFHLPKFTPSAKKLWMAIPLNIRNQLLENVYCGECRGVTTITNYSGSVKSGTLILSGKCKACGAEVARVID